MNNIELAHEALIPKSVYEDQEGKVHCGLVSGVIRALDAKDRSIADLLQAIEQWEQNPTTANGFNIIEHKDKIGKRL